VSETPAHDPSNLTDRLATIFTFLLFASIFLFGFATLTSLQKAGTPPQYTCNAENAPYVLEECDR
jgi:hypothetical protein